MPRKHNIAGNRDADEQQNRSVPGAGVRGGEGVRGEQMTDAPLYPFAYQPKAQPDLFCDCAEVLEGYKKAIDSLHSDLLDSEQEKHDLAEEAIQLNGIILELRREMEIQERHNKDLVAELGKARTKLFALGQG